MVNINISVSIVTYNNENEICGVLDSLFASSIIDNLEIYIVDNNSTDGTIPLIKEKYAQLNIIEMSSNLGYGGGHNVAINRVNSKYHFIINPDIKFDSKLLENIVGFLENKNDVVLCIPNIHDVDNKLKYPPKKDPTIRFLLGRYLSKYGGVFRKWADEYECKNIHLDQPIEIEFCSGSFMATRTDVLKKVNGFDDHFFLYFEDADLSRRMREYGKVVCNPIYAVQHEGKRESHKSFKAFKLMLVSMIKYFNKWGWKF